MVKCIISCCLHVYDHFCCSDKLEEAKELQSIRKRSSGVSASGLAYGVQTTEEETLAVRYIMILLHVLLLL
jgi:hypothetical protein